MNAPARASLISTERGEEMPSNPAADEVARLRQELAATRDKLEAAQWALAHLGSTSTPLDQRLQAMVDQAVAEAQLIKAEARQHVEALVTEAEHLRAFAKQGAEGSARQARHEVVQKASAMIEDANKLRATAELQAAELLRTAQARYQEVKARAEDLQRTAQHALSEALERRAEVDRQVAEARERAGALMRAAQADAEARSNELIDLARKQLYAAQQEAEQIIQVAEQNSRTKPGKDL